MAPQKKKVELNPAELTMDLTSAAAPTTTLTISNPSDEHLAFKVRTTQPKRYLVKPNQDVIPAMGNVTVTIQMQARECAAILEQGFEDAGKDKFMVSSRVVDEAFMKSLKGAKEAGSKDVQQLFTTLWDNTEKDDIMSRRIACNFTQSSAPGSAQRSSAAPAASPVAASPGEPASAIKPSAAKPASSSTAAPTPAAAPQASPPSLTAVAAAQVQTPSKKAEEVLENMDTNASAPRSAMRGADAESSNFETLSKQYKETLATLVQVTEERDRFQAKFKEMSRELMQLREESRSARKGGNLDSEFSQPTSIARTGYPFWHLIVVALVSFMVARILQMSKNDFLSS